MQDVKKEFDEEESRAGISWNDGFEMQSRSLEYDCLVSIYE